MPEPSQSTVLLPLYIYPAPGSWDPLYTAITQHPTLHFIIILNPHNGPGSYPWWPNVDYTREIPKLNALPNVQTIGYIGTTYGKKPLAEILAQIEQYADWSRDERFKELGVGGIFFDETPNQYTAEVEAYLNGITDAVRCADGISGDRMVIHNPGTSVDPRLARPGPDITVVAELGWAQFVTAEYQEWLATSPYERGRTCYMIHSTPMGGVERLVGELRGRARYLFVTALAEGCYQSFGEWWDVFVKAMAREGA